MSTSLTVILEIIKVTVPALIVFLTVYYIMKTFYENQLKVKQMELKQNSARKGMPLQLQAYERLSLFCERISIPNLLLRLRTDEMTVRDLKIAILLAIQQEYEYNITQQVYVGEKLWEIIKLARDESVSLVNEMSANLAQDANARELAGSLLHFLDDKVTAPEKAQIAIKKEAGILLL